MRCPHCDTEVTEHPASRCLDAWVATDVMQHHVERRWCLPEYECAGYDEAESWHDDDEPPWNIETLSSRDDAKKLPCVKNGDWWEVCPEYSTRIKDAWRVVEKIGRVTVSTPDAPLAAEYSTGDKYEVEHCPPGVHVYDPIMTSGDTPMLAIVRAALLASE